MKARHLWLAAFTAASFVIGVRVPAPAIAAQSPQIPIAGSSIPQFVQPLPVLDAAGGSMQTVSGSQPLTIHMCEFDANVLPPGTFVKGVQPHTRVWGYVAGAACPAPGSAARDTYLGPIVLATRGIPTQVTWVNDLGDTASSRLLAYRYSTDQTLHWADPANDGANMCAHMDTPPAFGSECAQNYAGSIPAVTHLHGGEVPAQLDGGPSAWFTSDGAHAGPTYYTKNPATDAKNSAVYTYPNVQEAAPIWFHDHTLGATRLNVYAGLAGGYLIADPNLALPAGLAAYGLDNAGSFEPTVPLIIQDRMFDTNGQLFFPADSAGGTLWSLNPDRPYWVPEFLGDTILVNGKAWPFYNVEPKRYRFLFLNGSNARTYAMQLTDPVSKNPGPPLWVVATDGGYLDSPVKIDPTAKGLNKLLMMPGERYEAIVDFSKYAAGVQGPNGQRYSGTWLLTNNAKSPYPGGDTPQGSTTGKIMEFRVGACTTACGNASTSYDPASGTAIRSGSQWIVRLVDPATGTLAAGVHPDLVRELTLNEIANDNPTTAVDPVTGQTVTYPGGPLEVVLNNTAFDGNTNLGCRSDFTPVTVGGSTTCVSERPREGTTEIWEIVNTTADAHPIHLHLVQFQILNRQAYDTNKFDAVYSAAFAGGAYRPESGPPLAYAPTAASGGKFGGNPDVTPFLKGPLKVPEANEAGWKDTIMTLPGQVTRIAVRWAPTDIATSAPGSSLYFPFDPTSPTGYVWHCHIIDHEDSEMMRPDVLQPNPLAPAVRPLVAGVDY